MNKIIIGIVIVLLLTGAGVGGYFLMNKQSPSPTPTTAITEVETSVESTTSVKSLRDLFMSTTNQTCSFTDDSQNTGTVYSSGGRVRADFDTTHIVSDGSSIYLWIDGQAEGYKMPLAQIEKYQTTGTAATKTVDVNKQVNVDCTATTADASKFVLPDMKFTDFSLPVEMTESQCGTCASLPADAAAQCRTALNCN